MALSHGRNTPEINGKFVILGVKAGTKIYEGSIVAIEDGFAVPAYKSSDLTAAGRAEFMADNSEGEDGEILIHVKRGVFAYENDTVNPVTSEDILKNCYAADDETVTSLSTGSCVVGKVISIKDGQVYVEIK